MEDVYEKYMHTRGSELVYVNGWMDGWMREGEMKSQTADAHSKGNPQALCKPKPQDDHRFLTEENKTQRQQVEFKQARYLTSF